MSVLSGYLVNLPEMLRVKDIEQLFFHFYKFRWDALHSSANGFGFDAAVAAICCVFLYNPNSRPWFRTLVGVVLTLCLFALFVLGDSQCNAFFLCYYFLWIGA